MMDIGQSRGTNAGTSTTRGVSSNGGVRPVRVAVVVILLFGFSARRRELRECDSTSGVLAHTTHPLLRGGYNAREQLSVLTVWGLEASGGLNGRGAAAPQSVTLPWLVTRNNPVREVCTDSRQVCAGTRQVCAGSGGLGGQRVIHPDFPETRNEVSGRQVGDQVAILYFVRRNGSFCAREYLIFSLAFALKYGYTLRYHVYKDVTCEFILCLCLCSGWCMLAVWTQRNVPKRCACRRCGPGRCVYGARVETGLCYDCDVAAEQGIPCFCECVADPSQNT